VENVFRRIEAEIESLQYELKDLRDRFDDANSNDVFTQNSLGSKIESTQNKLKAIEELYKKLKEDVK